MSDTDNFKSINPDGSFEYVLDESGLHETTDEQVRPPPPVQSQAPSSTTSHGSGGPNRAVIAVAAVALVAALGVGAFLMFGGSGDGDSADSGSEEAAGFKPYAGGGAAAEVDSKPIEVAKAPEEEEDEEVVIEESEPVPDEPGWDLEEPEEVPVEVEVVEEVVDDSEEDEVAELEEVEEPELEERPRPIRVPREALRNTMITPMQPKMPTPTIVNPQIGNPGNIPIRRINPQTGKLEVRRPDSEDAEEELIE